LSGILASRIEVVWRDAEPGKVDPAHLLPAFHDIYAFGRAGGRDEEHGATAQLEKVPVNDIHRRRILT
jgi:hypothetical protein